MSSTERYEAQDRMPYHPSDILTREQAIAKAGEAVVKAAESDNCEPTSRLMPTGFEDVQEWAGQASEDGWHVSALYYPTDDQIDAAGDDLSNVDWRIDGYTVR